MPRAASSRVQPSQRSTPNTKCIAKDVVVIEDDEEEEDDVKRQPSASVSASVAFISAENVVTVITVAGVAVVYASTVFQDLPGGDSGELAGMTCALGAAHPPGYPLLVLLVSGWQQGITSVALNRCRMLRCQA
jgi:hypothetical protein